MGLSLHTTATDMVQAVLEGVAFRTAEVFLALERNQPVTGRISLDGRMTENAFFVQFLSNVLQRELSLSSEPELTAIGTATLAAEVTGIDSGYVARQQVITRASLALRFRNCSLRPERLLQRSQDRPGNPPRQFRNDLLLPPGSVHGKVERVRELLTGLSDKRTQGQTPEIGNRLENPLKKVAF